MDFPLLDRVGSALEPDWRSHSLRQIVLNLLSNTVKFTEHGEILASVGQQSRSQAEAAMHICVAVTKPIRQRELRDALLAMLTAQKSSAASLATPTSQLVTRHTIREG